MLSALTGIQSDTVVNYTITKHFNERTCIEPLISNLTQKDTVILDRGYFSKQIFYLFHTKGVGCVMRIKKDANITAKKFFNSRKRNLITTIIYNGTLIPIRYIKYMIEGKIFMIATSIFNKTVKQIKDIYKLRWRVELSFKRLKSHLNIKKIHSKSELLWKQELQVRILLDTLTRTKQIIDTQKHLTNKQKITYKYILIQLVYDLILNKIKYFHSVLSMDLIQKYLKTKLDILS